MITLDNVHDAARDQIVFDNAITEVLAGKVNVSSATSLAHALDMAAADAAASQNGGEIAAHAGVIDWFQYDGKTYILEAVNGSGSPGTHSALEATDALVEVTGSASLSGRKSSRTYADPLVSLKLLHRDAKGHVYVDRVVVDPPD